MCSFLLIHPMLLKRYFLNTLLRPLLHWLCLADTDKSDIRILMIWLTKGNNDNAQESPSSPRPCFHFSVFSLRSSCFFFTSSGWSVLLVPLLPEAGFFWTAFAFTLAPFALFLSIFSFPLTFFLGVCCFPLGFLGVADFLGLAALLLSSFSSDSISFSGSSFSLLSSAFLFPMATAVAGQVRLTKEYKGQPMYILCDLKNA